MTTRKRRRRTGLGTAVAANVELAQRRAEGRLSRAASAVGDKTLPQRAERC